MNLSLTKIPTLSFTFWNSMIMRFSGIFLQHIKQWSVLWGCICCLFVWNPGTNFQHYFEEDGEGVQTPLPYVFSFHKIPLWLYTTILHKDQIFNIGCYPKQKWQKVQLLLTRCSINRHCLEPLVSDEHWDKQYSKYSGDFFFFLIKWTSLAKSDKDENQE